MDSNLFKEAIADARAVKQTALANAKVALEEAFSERYQAMFAEKLKEDAEMGESKPAEEEGSKCPEENVSEQEVDELIKELEAEVGEEPHAEPDADDIAPGGADEPVTPGAALPGAAGAPAGAPPAGLPGTPGVPGAPAMVMCPVGSVATAEMPPAPPVGGTVPSMPPTPPVGGAVPPMPPTGEPAVGGEMPSAPATPPSDVPPVSGDEEADEDVDLNELLESLKEEISAEEEEEGCKEEEEEGKLDEQKKLASSTIGGSKAGGSDNKKPSSSASSTSAVESGGMKQEGMPSPDNTKVGPSDATKASRPNKGKNATPTNLSTPSMGEGNGSGGQSETGHPNPDNTKVTAKEATKASRPNQGSNATKDNLSTPGGTLEENKSLKNQLNEAEEVIKYVKGQLNEVNLLNAKLLYTNKLFKEYNMNNDHKMRIVEMFDLAKTVREVKLTYANIAESLNFSGKNITRRVVSSTNSSVQSITEGLASKPVGSTKPKEIISEGKFASRMKQLAGIRSEPRK